MKPTQKYKQDLKRIEEQAELLMRRAREFNRLFSAQEITEQEKQSAIINLQSAFLAVIRVTADFL